jgi:hypothetical protein
MAAVNNDEPHDLKSFSLQSYLQIDSIKLVSNEIDI